MREEEEKNLAATKRLVELYNQKADELVDLFISPDFERKDFRSGRSLRGIDNFRRSYREFQEIVPDRRMMIRRIMAGDDSVAVEVHCKGTVAKQTEGMPPVGETIEEEMCIIFRFRDGLVVSEYFYGGQTPARQMSESP